MEQYAYRIEESKEAKAIREKIDKLTGEAVKRHLETHMMYFGYPELGYQEIFDDIVRAGYYNGKTVTFKTPQGTITFHAEVKAPND